MVAYPGSIKTFIDKVDNVDTVYAQDINDLQDEVHAIEDALAANPYAVDDSAAIDGSPSSVKDALDQIAAALKAIAGEANWYTAPDATLAALSAWCGAYDGWIPDSDTWVYVSATSFKIIGKDVTARFIKGTKLKFTQTTAKYANVSASAMSGSDTLVTIFAGTDYSIANDTITLPKYSYHSVAVGFPEWFNYTPTWAGTGGTPDINNGTMVSRCRLVGSTCIWAFRMTWGAGTTANSATAWTFSLPFQVSNNAISFHGTGYIRDTGTANYFPKVAVTFNVTVLSRIYTGADGSNVSALAYNVPHTWASGDSFEFQLSYEIL